jgi:hypothetical protein
MIHNLHDIHGLIIEEEEEIETIIIITVHHTLIFTVTHGMMDHQLIV